MTRQGRPFTRMILFRDLGAEQRLADGRADNHHIRGAFHVVVGEGTAFNDGPLADVEVLGRYTFVAGGPVLVAVDHLHVTVGLRRAGFDHGHLRHDGVQIVHDQRLGLAGAGAHAGDVASAGFHPHQVVAEQAELLLDAIRSGRSQRHYADHRADADHHAEHRQGAAQFVAAERA